MNEAILEPRRLSPEQRIEAFHKRFPQYLAPSVHNRRLYTMWLCGALFSRKNGYYGSYPHSVKERIYALFPDCPKVVHLFSGSVNELGSITYDRLPELNPTICDDIMNIASHGAELKDADLFIADPPYDSSDFEKYGVKPFNKPKAIREIAKVAKPHAFLAWLDTRIPRTNKQIWGLLGYLGLSVSTNTRVRCWTLLERTENAVPD
jgi:hypothetical protein